MGGSSALKLYVMGVLPFFTLEPEVAGDFHMIIIMVILLIIIILHHGADDYNHMAMQGDLQLGLHDGGY